MLATNQLYFVQAADLVIYMSEGRVAEAGPYHKLMASGGQFSTMMKEVQVEEEEEEKAMVVAAEPNVAAPSTVVITHLESDKVCGVQLSRGLLWLYDMCRGFVL